MSGSSLQRRLTLASLLLAGSVLGSRLLGFVRDAVIAYLMGAGRETDMYYAAFTLPDMMNYFLLGGALSITFVPLYGRLVAEGRREAERLVGVVVGTVGAALIALTLVGLALAEPLVGLVFPGFDAEQVARTAALTRIIFPGQLFFFLGGILSAVCMVHERFLPAALAPVLYNLSIIVFGVLLAPHLGIAGFSVGALVGAIAGPFFVPWWVSRRFVRVRPALAPRHPLLRRYVWISLPLMVGVTLLTADEWIGRYFGSDMAAGTITWLQNARRVMLVPMALVGQAAAQAALPYLSRLVAEARRDELRQALTGTLAAVVFLATLAAVALAWLAVPAIGAIFERGRFTRADTLQTARMLTLYCPAIVALATEAVAVRGFYAHADTWRPMLLGTAITAVSLPVYAALAAGMAGPGLALATSIGLTLYALATLALYSRVYGAVGGLRLLGALGRGLLVGALASAPPLALGWLLVDWREALPWGLRVWLEVLVGGALYALFVVLVTRRLGGPEARVLEDLQARLARRRQARAAAGLGTAAPRNDEPR
jgi:putative peptidoglycan lipid II flippase